MNNEIKLGDSVFKSENETNEIFEAVHKGEPCYCVLHRRSGAKALFDHDEALLKSIRDKVNRCGAIVCNRKKNGLAAFTFRRHKKENKIALSMYLFAKYHGYSTNMIRRHKIRRLDESLQEYGIVDLRKSNLYDAGGNSPIARKLFVQVLHNPENETEKCLAVTLSENMKVIEIYNYSDQLHQMLTNSRFCSLALNESTGRVVADVHHSKGKDGYRPMNLSRLVRVYYSHFNRYEKCKGSIRQFLRDVPNLSDVGHDGQHGAHTNAQKWNGDALNLIWMDSTTNTDMNDLAERFYGAYDFFPVAYRDGSILAEYHAHEITHYYKFDTPEEYLNFQKIAMGKCGLTTNLSAIYLGERVAGNILTPKETYNALGKPKRKREDTVANYWEWCKKRNEIFELYESQSSIFMDWKCVPDKVNLGDTESILKVIGLFIPV